MFASLEKSWVAIGLRRPPSDLAEERGGSGSLPATDCRSLASVQSCRWLGSGRGMAIANPVRYHRFFRRYLSNAPLMDLRVGAVPFNIDLGLDRRSTSTDLLENITIICLPKVLGAAASYLERSEFRLQLQRWVDTAGHLSVDWQATGLQPIIRLAVGLKCPLELPQPAAKSRPVIREACGACGQQRASRSDGQQHTAGDRVGIIFTGNDCGHCTLQK